MIRREANPEGKQQRREHLTCRAAGAKAAADPTSARSVKVFMIQLYIAVLSTRIEMQYRSSAHCSQQPNPNRRVSFSFNLLSHAVEGK